MLGFRRRNPFVWSYLRPFWPSFLWIGAVLIFQILLNVLAPLPTKFILNNLLRSEPDALHNVVLYGYSFGSQTATQAIIFLTAVTLAIAFLLIAASWAEQVGTSNIVFRSRELMRRNLLSRIFTRQQSYLDSKKKVDLLGRFSGDVENTEILLVNGVPSMVRDIPILFVMIVVMFTVSPRLTLLFCAFLPFAVFGGHFFTQRNRKASKLVRRKTVHLEEETYELMNAMGIIKSLQGEERISRRLIQRVEELTQLSKLERNAAVGLDSTVMASSTIIKSVFIMLGGLAIFRGEIGWGDLFQILSYIEIFSRHVNSLTKFVAKYPKCMASVDRLEELNRELNLYPEVSGSRPLEEQRVDQAPLRFENVSFRYGDAAPILFGFSHSFQNGALTAVVGQSGIGKSSFSRLLNRLSDPGEGSVVLAGHDLREYPVKDLRRVVRVISQESLLLAGSVRENLQLATFRTLTDREIREALEAVNAWEFVSLLPEGLDTAIGEGGLQLSGGQAKRIHLARAFLDLDSRVVIFDEPTTGLDTHSAEAVMESIQHLAGKKSLVFWITHRMQEVKMADQVLFFTPGHNPVVNRPQTLLAENTRFRALMESEGKSRVRQSETLASTGSSAFVTNGADS